LKALKLAFSLLSDDNGALLMRRKENSPLRVMIRQYQNQNTPVKDCIHIVEFLTFYAQTADGAQQLYEENLIAIISSGEIIQSVNT
jgi:hypothetical protein